MKRIVISLLALTVLMACNNKKEEKNLASQNTIDSLTDIVNQKNNELNDIMSTFNDIQEGFREINEAEGRVNIARNNGETNAKADIMENIVYGDDFPQTQKKWGVQSMSTNSPFDYNERKRRWQIKVGKL